MWIQLAHVNHCTFGVFECVFAFANLMFERNLFIANNFHTLLRNINATHIFGLIFTDFAVVDSC